MPYRHDHLQPACFRVRIEASAHYRGQKKKEQIIATHKDTIQFHMSQEERRRLESLPWHAPLEQWPDLGVSLLHIRRGESRHPVVFVEQEGIRYAIKETSPHMAEREVRNLQEIGQRGVPTLTPAGSITVSLPPIALHTSLPGGLASYLSGDRGYLVTRLALRVVPHAFLYRLPLNRRTRRHILSAIAVLMVELHEHGIYWGDPSLANILLRIDGRRILAIMADAETAEYFPGAVNDRLREQDLASFGESLAWQAEDLRQARGLPEDQQPLDDADFRYFLQRYRWLRREHRRLARPDPSSFTLEQAQQFLQKLNSWGFSLLGMTGRTLQELTAVRPGWYQQRIRQLLHIEIPRAYARRFYNMILGHQALASEKAGHPISIEEAAQQWYSHYHLPALLLLRQVLTAGQDPLKAYFQVMLHKWNMSKRAGYEIPLDEAIVDWSMTRASTGSLGEIDPALRVKWERDLEPEGQILAPSLLEHELLDPLVTTAERPLVHRQPTALDEPLPAVQPPGSGKHDD
jgi:serine/threonine protein kinase